MVKEEVKVSIKNRYKTEMLCRLRSLCRHILLPICSCTVGRYRYEQHMDIWTCMDMYVYMSVCVSHCWFLALLEHSLPSQHPLHCDCSRVQVNCELLRLRWATNRTKTNITSYTHTNVHRRKHACCHACTHNEIKIRDELVVKTRHNLQSYFSLCFTKVCFFFLKLHLFLSCFHRIEFHRYKS